MRDSRRPPRDLSAMESLHDELRDAVHSEADLGRDDVLALSRRLDQIAFRLQRLGIVRTEAGWHLPPSMEEGRPSR